MWDWWVHDDPWPRPRERRGWLRHSRLAPPLTPLRAPVDPERLSEVKAKAEKLMDDIMELTVEDQNGAR
jgi:hypothetical protein